MAHSRVPRARFLSVGTSGTGIFVRQEFDLRGISSQVAAVMLRGAQLDCIPTWHRLRNLCYKSLTPS